MARTRNSQAALKRERHTAQLVDDFIARASSKNGRIDDADAASLVVSASALSAMDLARLSGLLPLVAAINAAPLREGRLVSLAQLLIAMDLPLLSHAPTLADVKTSHNWTPRTAEVAVYRSEEHAAPFEVVPPHSLQR